MTQNVGSVRNATVDIGVLNVTVNSSYFTPLSNVITDT